MAVTITHSTLADGTFSATGAAAWDATHTVSGLGTMAEQDANNVNITGGSITGVTGVLSSLTVNSTPTSGGAAGQIMFDTGSVLQESSNLVWDNTNKKLTITGATVTTSQPVLDMTQTWNNAATTFTGLKFNANDTASAAASLLMDLQVGGVSYANIDKSGSFTIGRYNTTGFYGLKYDTSNGNLTLSRSSTGTVVSTWSASGNSFSVGTVIAVSQLQLSSNDTILTRRAAANLRFGAADAAAPVAQTLSVQSVVAGTSNTAGANLTITGSQGTGTGAGGSIIFQTAPAGTTGTAQNALATALTIDSTGKATFAPTTNSTNSFAITNLAGSIVASVDSTNRRFNAGGGAGGASFSVSTATGNTTIYNAGAFGWTDGGGADVGTFNLILTRRGAANLRFGAADAAAPVAQTLSVQSVVAGTSNTAGANLTITGSQGTGTGAGGSIIFQTADVGAPGTAQNTLVTALRIYSNQTVAVGKAYTVATLPAAGTQGRRAWVTDATAPIFLGALTGGGAVVCPVFDDGVAWRAG